MKGPINHAMDATIGKAERIYGEAMGREDHDPDKRPMFREAERLYLEAAESGDVRGMIGLGYLYSYGRSGRWDQDAAKRWFKVAADLGSAEATYKYGDVISAAISDEAKQHFYDRAYELAQGDEDHAVRGSAALRVAEYLNLSDNKDELGRAELLYREAIDELGLAIVNKPWYAGQLKKAEEGADLAARRCAGTAPTDSEWWAAEVDRHPAGYFDYAEPISKLDGLLGFFSERGISTVVRDNTADGYDYLEDGCEEIEAVNPWHGEGLFVELSGEFTLCFFDWHTHYASYELDYGCLLDDIKGVLENEKVVLTSSDDDSNTFGELLDIEEAEKRRGRGMRIVAWKPLTNTEP